MVPVCPVGIGEGNADGTGVGTVPGTTVFTPGMGDGVWTGTGVGTTVQEGTWQQGSLGSVVMTQPGLSLYDGHLNGQKRFE